MKTLFLIGVVFVAAQAVSTAQDPLSAARDLYAAAAYEDALSTLNRIDADSSAPGVAKQVDEYRAFCLFALGRTREAESVAEAIVRKRPLAGLEAVDASPRVETMFSDVRKRLLPSLIRDQFRAARAAIDRKSFAAAEPPLTEARLMILDAEKLGVKDDGLPDLKVLVDGFLGLIQSAAEVQPAASPQRSTTIEPQPAPRAAAIAPPAPPPPAVPEPAGIVRTYTITDANVSPPITIRQRLPSMPPQLQTIARAVHASGVYDLVIDETGRVADATVRQSMNASYDSLVLRSTRDWRYEPAMKDGVPVRYVKTIMLVP